MFNSAGSPDARDFFRGRASLWGEPVSHDSAPRSASAGPAPAGSNAPPPSPGRQQRQAPQSPSRLGAAAGSPGLLAPQPRWGRISSSAPAAATPSPRRAAADHSEVTPPKLDLGNAGLPRLLRASTGPRPAASNDPQPASNSPQKRSGSATPPRLLSAPLPAWTQAAPADEATVESIVSHRLRGKTSPRVAFRTGGPASSLGGLLDNIQDIPVPTIPHYNTPMKRPRTARWMTEMRGTAMLQVPIEALENTDEVDCEQRQGRPKRIRIPTLEFWRGERVIYERTKGSAAPSVCGVLLNGAPRGEDLWKRTIPPKAAQLAVPVVVDGAEAEFVSTASQTISSKLVVLPPFSFGRTNPPTFVLPAFSMGHIFVVEGSVSYGFEGEMKQATLKAGDHLVLPGIDEEMLFAVAGTRQTSTGAKFKVILVNVDGLGRQKNRNSLEEVPPLTHDDAPPLGDADASSATHDDVPPVAQS